MKISVITMHCVYNYGSALQTLATQQILTELGYEVEFIDYRRDSNSMRYILTNGISNDSMLLRPIKLIRRIPSVLKQQKVFLDFMDRNINLSAVTYKTIDELKNNPPEADIYCTGSDQVWNSSWNEGFLPAYFLEFGSYDTQRIAFSSSIGKEQLEEWEIPLFKTALKNYSFITVRELSAVQLLDSIGIESKLVLDPTLVIEPSFWYDFASENLILEDYVLIYQLNKNKDFDDYAVRFAQRKGMKLIRICYWYDHMLLPGKGIVLPSVEEFVSLFVNASFVITDSFHGTAFSLNLNKEVICIYPNHFSTRINSILQLTETEARHLTSFDDLNIADKPINTDRVSMIIDTERKLTIQYLLNGLAGKE